MIRDDHSPGVRGARASTRAGLALLFASAAESRGLELVGEGSDGKQAVELCAAKG